MTVKTGKKQVVGALVMVLSVLAMSPTSSYAVQDPVVLGTAGSYVILSKTGVSTTGVTAVVGNIGVSAAAATYITGFGLIADATNTFSTSSFVTGKIYAANYAVPTPANLTTSIGDMETAYTAAAGRILPDFTELYTGDLSGKTLVPGLYKWGTGVIINGDVTLAGNANAVWIFQIAQNLTVGNGAMVTLSGGAQPQNIFWQVAGQATLGTTSDFKGIILCKTLIAMQTGSVLNGRALAQTAVTLAAATVIAPAGNVSLRKGEIILSDSKVPLSSTAVVYDIYGTSKSLARQSAGSQNWVFSQAVPPGIYFMKSEAAGQTRLKKLVLLP